MLELDIINKSRRNINLDLTREILTRLVDIYFPKKEVFLELLFVGNTTITRLNKEFLKRKGPTDIISFPSTNPEKDSHVVLGSMVICLIYLEEHHEKLEEVIIHGFIHLLGFDHETDQKKWDLVLGEIKKQINLISN